MLTKFWESLGEGLSEKWLTLLGPSLVFWTGGLFLTFGWKNVGVWSSWLLGLAVAQQLLVLIGSLVLLMASGAFFQRMSYHVLRLLEGYWNSPFIWLKKLLIKRQKSLVGRWELQWQGLAQKRSSPGLSAEEANRIQELESNLHYVPSDPNDYMPTTLGNILRMAETQPRHKYGLDPVICWPRLWHLLSEPLREELGNSRKSINESVEFWAFGVLFLLWSYWSWWAIPIGLAWAWITYGMILDAAKTYADLVEAAFDTQRWDLYHALHLKLPTGISSEVSLGEKVTEYLWRGTLPGNIKFKHPKP